MVEDFIQIHHVSVYITEDAITLPGELTKNGRELVLPNLINAELEAIKKVEECDYYFPTAAGGPFCSWGKNKINFDKVCSVTKLDAPRHPPDGADEALRVELL